MTTEPKEIDVEAAARIIRDKEADMLREAAPQQLSLTDRVELLSTTNPTWGAGYVNDIVTLLSNPARKELSIGISISYQRIADLMATFFESNDPVSASWYRGASVPIELRKLARKTQMPWYADPATWAEPDLVITLKVDKPTHDDTGVRYIRLRDLQRGFAALATVQDGAYVHHFADIMADNVDAGTADIFMQMVCFGEEVYA